MPPTTAREIPWNRLIVEGLAIIVSILLAFAIDAWWDERNERVEEQEILQGLHEEFELIHDVLTDHMQDHLGRVQATEEILKVFEAGDYDLDSQGLAAALDDLIAPATSDISNGVLRALLSSGRLEIISNRALRAKLVGWESAIEEVWDDQRDQTKRVFEIHMPYFIGEGFGVGELNSKWNQGNTMPVRSISSDPAELERLLQDPRFHTMGEFNYLFKQHLTQEFETAIAAADDILAEIDASIVR